MTGSLRRERPARRYPILGIEDYIRVRSGIIPLSRIFNILRPSAAAAGKPDGTPGKDAYKTEG
jgi:hypothetical protein